VDETDPEALNFRNFRSSVTVILTWDQVLVTLVRISSQGLPTHEIRYEIGQTFCGQTDVRTDRPEFQSIRSSPGDDLKSKAKTDDCLRK